MRNAFISLLILSVSSVSYSGTFVLCSAKSGSLNVRTSCKKSESLVDPVAIGLVGPRGPAGPGLVINSYAISATSGGGYLEYYSADNKINFTYYCNYGGTSYGYQWWADDPSIGYDKTPSSPASVVGTVMRENTVIATRAWNDLSWNHGGQDNINSSAPTAGIDGIMTDSNPASAEVGNFLATYGAGKVMKIETYIYQYNNVCYISVVSNGVGSSTHVNDPSP